MEKNRRNKKECANNFASELQIILQFFYFLKKVVKAKKDAILGKKPFSGKYSGKERIGIHFA